MAGLPEVSRKQFKKAVLPEVGTVIDDKYKVKWVHYGQFRFTAETDGEKPEVGHLLEWQGKHYIITLHLPEKKFSATFYGFVKNPAAEMTEEELEETGDVSTESEAPCQVPVEEEETPPG